MHGFDSVLPGRICEGCGVWKYDWSFDEGSDLCHECAGKKARTPKLQDRVQSLEQEVSRLRSLLMAHLEGHHEGL